MGLGDIWQTGDSFIVKHGYAKSGIAITKGDVVKREASSVYFDVADEGDEMPMAVALDSVGAKDTDRKFRMLIEGTVEVTAVSGFPIYFMDELISAANGGVRKVADMSNHWDELVGFAINHKSQPLTSSGIVPIKLAE